MFSAEGLRVLVICALRWCEVSLHLPSSRSAVFTDQWELRTSEYGAFYKVMNMAQFLKKNGNIGTSLVVQWLKLHVSIAGGTGLIPG